MGSGGEVGYSGVRGRERDVTSFRSGARQRVIDSRMWVDDMCRDFSEKIKHRIASHSASPSSSSSSSHLSIPHHSRGVSSTTTSNASGRDCGVGQILSSVSCDKIRTVAAVGVGEDGQETPLSSLIANIRIEVGTVHS